jgi:hypothetical protein
MMSCSPAAKLRRAEKLIAKAEEQGAKWHVDSVVVEIPVPIESVRVDTVLKVKVGDTVVIQKDRLKTIIRRLPGDTIVLFQECQADTIKVKVTKTIRKTIAPKKGYSLWELIILAIAALGVGFAAGRFIKFR